ncbi:MAG: ACR3 family arsenite efflux transporter [Candidatus Heimdallarchaeaceae archaeon]
MDSKKLSILDKFLPVWILLTMVIGVLLGKFVPQFVTILDAFRIDTVSFPIAIGLLWMMYPVLAKVQYEKLAEVSKDWKVFTYSLFLNWAIGPFVMYGLAKLFLSSHQGYMEGIILVGLARCIAMVLIWNLLAGGDNEKAAILVAINSVLQILLYSVYAYFLIGVSAGDISMWRIAKSVLIFLGIPLLAGFVTRVSLRKWKGAEWYDTKFVPKLSPTAIIGLLFTIIVMFAMKGELIVNKPLDIVLIAIPLTLYFVIMFILSFVSSWLFKFYYKDTVTISFTAASNNFELAIAVAIGVFGIDSDQALATVVGPLIEVPVLLSLVYLSKWLKNRMFASELITQDKKLIQMSKQR